MTSAVPGSAPSAVVVIPTYNEAENIAAILDAVLALPGLDVLVVDDGSPDGTAELVARHREYDRRLHLIVRHAKDGLGAAYRCGFRWALSAGYPAIVQMDADRSHPPERIPALLEALRTSDVVIGSRYVRGGRVVNWSWSRRLISATGNAYIRVVLGLRVRDSTAGFKAFRREALLTIDAVHSTSNGYCFQVENTWAGSRHGLRTSEIPITFTDRTAGTSKMTSGIAAEALLRVLGWRWAQLIDAHVATHRAPTVGSAYRSARS